MSATFILPLAFDTCPVPCCLYCIVSRIDGPESVSCCDDPAFAPRCDGPVSVPGRQSCCLWQILLLSGENASSGYGRSFTAGLKSRSSASLIVIIDVLSNDLAVSSKSASCPSFSCSPFLCGLSCISPSSCRLSFLSLSSSPCLLLPAVASLLVALSHIMIALSEPPSMEACPDFLYSFLASSYALTPSTDFAEKSGATCSCSPMNRVSAFRMASAVICAYGNILSTSFSRSYDGVVAPKLMPATYSLSCDWSRSAIFVALPMHTSSIPVANGSSVPAWPTFRFFFPKCLIAAYFILRMTSAEVHLYGLSTGITIPPGYSPMSFPVLSVFLEIM